MTSVSFDLRLTCSSEVEARSLALALTPDNKGVPKDQEFSTSQEGNVLVFHISSERTSGCFSTILSILSDADLFQQVWGITSRLSP